METFNADAHEGAGASGNPGISPKIHDHSSCPGSKPLFLGVGANGEWGLAGSHDSSAATAEASSGKPLEGFGGHGRPLLLISTTRARPDAFRILEEPKPH